MTDEQTKVYLSPCAADLQDFVRKALGQLKSEYLLVVGSTARPPPLFKGEHYPLRIGPRQGPRHVIVAYGQCPDQTVYRRCTHAGLSRMIMKLESSA